MNVYRALVGPAQFTVKAVAIVAVCATLAYFSIEHARLRMERRAQQERVCAAELAVIRSTSAWAQKAFCSADPCGCVQILAKEIR